MENVESSEAAKEEPQVSTSSSGSSEQIQPETGETSIRNDTHQPSRNGVETTSSIASQDGLSNGSGKEDTPNGHAEESRGEEEQHISTEQGIITPPSSEGNSVEVLSSTEANTTVEQDDIITPSSQIETQPSAHDPEEGEKTREGDDSLQGTAAQSSGETCSSEESFHTGAEDASSEGGESGEEIVSRKRPLSSGGNAEESDTSQLSSACTCTVCSCSTNGYACTHVHVLMLDCLCLVLVMQSQFCCRLVRREIWWRGERWRWGVWRWGVGRRGTGRTVAWRRRVWRIRKRSVLVTVYVYVVCLPNRLST